MSEQETTPADRPVPGGQEWEGDPEAAEAIRSLFVTLAKTFRAYQLYDENNPVRHRFVDQLRGEFREMWDELDELVVHIDEDHLYVDGAEVYQAESRNDSLAFLFFKDGVREITFLPGIEQDELEAFLGVLGRARKLVPEGDDLLTVLWEAQLEHFRYQYIDLLAEGVALPEAGPGAGEAELHAVLEAEDQEDEVEDGAAAAEQEAAPQTVSQDDFNPTLYALDAREMETLRSELQKELERDIRGDVLKALFDRLEEAENRERQAEILRILETLLPNFLSRGALVAATLVLKELRRLESTEEMLDEQGVAQAERMLDNISSPETIEELIQALFDGTIRVSAKQLSEFLSFLRAGALSPLLHASETVEHKELQTVLRRAVQGIADRDRAAVVALLEEDDPILVVAAARLAGEMQITEVGPGLAKLLGHDAPEVRLAAVEAAITLKASTAAGALEQALEDAEREVRIAAARALEVLRYRPAKKPLESIVKGKRIRDADISEKVAMFEAYAVVAEAEGLPLLEGFLNKKGFLGKREPTEIRAAAALALGRIPGADARSALEEATQDDDPVVRSSVNRALRSEEGA